MNRNVNEILLQNSVLNKQNYVTFIELLWYELRYIKKITLQ